MEEEAIDENTTEGYMIYNDSDRNVPNSDTDEDLIGSTQEEKEILNDDE